jgi:hypothetical protein
MRSVEDLVRKVSNFIICCTISCQIDLYAQLAGKRNPIYHFYGSVSTNSQGQVGTTSNKHYRCHHGNHKVIMVTHAMKYSLNGK